MLINFKSTAKTATAITNFCQIWKFGRATLILGHSKVLCPSNFHALLILKVLKLTKHKRLTKKNLKVGQKLLLLLQLLLTAVKISPHIFTYFSLKFYRALTVDVPVVIRI